ncbi:hypothetical protein NE865_01377 [Phthorimaea operculella]|nr:hypothetical protein NE865_01377 [Phthorimaea operculella]
MTFRSIKVFLCAACLALSLAAPASKQPQMVLDIIDMAAISRMSPQQLEVLAEGLAAEEIMRTKRSSAQALSSVVSKASSGLQSGLQSKVGLLGQASAFISSASSKSGGDHEHTGYSYEPAEHDQKVDFWGLKKSILYTLFQAVKAITGGVTILKGQLIKGGGALATTLGKVIAVKGDAVSNLGKKIVNSAALSSKKPHSTPVYGPPPQVTHIHSYPPPTSYGAPTAPAYAHSAPSGPTGFGHKYPSHLDGRQSPKLNGVHAGVVILTPLGDTSEHDHQEHTGHTPLEPPPSVLNTVYSAIKNAFTSPASSYAPPPPSYNPPAPPTGYSTTGLAGEESNYLPPPPPPPIPAFKPMEMSWGAVDSYGQPAAADAFTDYDPRNPHPTFNHASSKNSIAPTRVVVKSSHHSHKLSPDKLNKINQNLEKLNKYLENNIQVRSSEEQSRFVGMEAFTQMLKKGQVPLLPTPVITDNEIGNYSARVNKTDMRLTEIRQHPMVDLEEK